VRNIRIPYGVLKSDKANLREIVEKPEYSFVINSGIYVLEPEIVDLICEGSPCDMPNLLVHAKNKGLKVQVYSMTSSWFDVGEWGEYRRAIDHMAEMGAVA
jgi:NDP-sugar pyrophosphorylase family protein